MTTPLIIKTLNESILDKLNHRENGWYGFSGNWTSATTIQTYEFLEYDGQDIEVSSNRGTRNVYVSEFDRLDEFITTTNIPYGGTNTTVNIDSSMIDRRARKLAFTFWTTNTNRKITISSREYAVQTVVEEHEVLNNEKEIEFILMENDETKNFINDIKTGYSAFFRGNEYKIYDPVYELVDDKVIVQCKAMHDYFIYFNGFYAQESWKDQSMTPVNSILPLFDGKKYTANILSDLYAAVMNNEGNVTYTERIEYAINRHEGERYIDGYNVNITSKLGTIRDDILLHPDANITEIKKEVSSAGLATWAKGFWGKIKDEEGNETEEYEFETTEVHPLLVEMYGTEAKEGKAIYNDSIKYESVMKEAIYKSLDDTFVLKYSMNIKDYDDPELFRTIQIGDTLNAVIDKLDADINLRVLELKRTWINEELKDMEIIIGNGGAKAEYSSPNSDIIMEDVINGKRELPYSAYNEGVRRATELINGDLNGNFQYMPDGVYGQDPNNPNHRTRYNISGIAYMTDGRQWNQALTFRGITASAIYTGTLRADLIEILGANGNYRASGGVSTWTDPTDSTKFTRVSPDGFLANKSKFEINAIDGRNVMADGLIRSQQIANIQTFTSKFDGRNVVSNSEEFERVYVLWDNYKARFLDIAGVTHLDPDSRSSSAHMEIMITFVGSEEELFRQREFINREFDPAIYSYTFKLDLQEIFGVVPDYRRFGFYVNTRLVTNYTGNTLNFRVNRGDFNDSHLL